MAIFNRRQTTTNQVQPITKSNHKKVFWGICKDEYKVDMGEDLKLYIAETIADNMCEAPIQGLETSTDPQVKNFLKRSTFYKIKRESEYLLAYKGICAWGILRDKNQKHFMVVLDICYQSNTEIWGQLDNNEFFNGLNTQYQVWVRYFFKGNTPYVQIYNIPSETNVNIDYIEKELSDSDSTIEYAFPEYEILPIKIISNTYTFKSDISRVSEANYKLLNKLSNETINLWEYSKQMWLNNANAGGNFNAKSLANKIKSGERIVESNSINADGTAPFLPFTNANSNELILQTSLINAIKDNILQLTFSMREILSGSNNKHNLENVKIDENALSYLKNKLTIREHQYNEFFQDLLGFDVKISMNLNAFSQFKLKAADPTTVPDIQLEGVKIKAQNVLDSINLKAQIAKDTIEPNSDGTQTTPPVSEKISI